jgi:hypothetical protein
MAESFPIAPVASRAFWIVSGGMLLVYLALMWWLGTSLAGAWNSTFTVRPDGLQLRGDWYGRTIPFDQLQVGAAQRVDLGANPSLLPRRRTWGTAWPGYQAGWFQLRNGERALVYVTDRRRAVYVPTTAGYSLLLSPDDPEAFLSALRTIGGS